MEYVKGASFPPPATMFVMAPSLPLQVAAVMLKVAEIGETDSGIVTVTEEKQTSAIFLLTLITCW